MAQNRRGWLTGDTLTGNRGRVLIIPGDINFLMAVNGALLPLIYAENWEKFGTVNPEDAAAAMQAMYLEYLKSEVILPVSDSEITIFPGSMTLLTGGAITTVANPSALHGYTSEITPNANGNSRRTRRFMQAGNWTYRLTAVTLAPGCSMTFSIVDADGTIHFLPAINLRTAATIFNAVFTGTFTLNQSGETEIFFGVNAGSTGGFRDLLTSLEMWRVS